MEIEERMEVAVRFNPYLALATKTHHATIDLDNGPKLSDRLRILAARYGQEAMNRVYSSDLGRRETGASVIVDSQVVPLPLGPNSNITLREGSTMLLMTPGSRG